MDWGFDFPVPHFTTVRLWLLRLGYYKLHRPKEQASDWVWIIDHSNPIGQEKCFVILGVRLSQLPPPGPEFPLRLSQMEPIELEPVTTRTSRWSTAVEANVAKPVFHERSSMITVATWLAELSCFVRHIARRSRFTTSATRPHAC